MTVSYEMLKPRWCNTSIHRLEVFDTYRKYPIIPCVLALAKCSLASWYCCQCGEITRFTHLQLIKAAFVVVLETRSIGSTWLQRERNSNCSLRMSKYEQELRKMQKRKRCGEKML